MKKILMILVLLGIRCVPAIAGDTTTNGYFYLPALGADGADERNTWFNKLQATDAIIGAMRSAVYWTDGTNSTLTGEKDLEASDLAITATWNFADGILKLPSGLAPNTAHCDASNEAGRIFVDTDATSGQQVYVCEGTSGWKLQGDGGGGGGGGGWTDGGTDIYLQTLTDKVGIGTSAPSKALEISGSDPNILLTDTQYTGTKWSIHAVDNGFGNGTNFGIRSTSNSGSTYSNDLFIWPGANVAIGTLTPAYPAKLTLKGAGTGSGSNLVLTDSSNNVKFSVSDDGTTGIGTTSPRGRLDIGTGNFYGNTVTVGTVNTGSGVGLVEATNGIGFDPNGTGPLMKLTTTRFVGIGTTAPTQILHVVGAPRFTGLVSCDTIDSDANGVLSCGTDTGGTAAGGWTDSGSQIYPTTLTDSVSIGTSSPGTGGFIGTLRIHKDTNNVNQMVLDNPNGGTAAQARMNISTATANGLFGVYPTNYISNDFHQGKTVVMSETGSGVVIEGQSASGEIILASGGGNERLRVESDGDIAIGTTSSTAKMLVAQTGAADSFRVNDAAADTSPFVIDQSGNVGVGTIAPSTQMHVVGNMRVTGLTSCDTIDTDSSGNMICGADNGGSVGGWTDAGTVVYATATGDNVAIGTTVASTKLQVAGTVTATAFAGDGSALTGISGSISGLTTTKIPKASSATAIVDSQIADDGTNVSLGTTTSNAKLLIEQSAAANALRVNDATGDGTPFIVDQDGNVGIGTVTATNPLEIRAATAALGFRSVSTAASGASSGSGILAGSDDGAAIASGDRLGFYGFTGATDASHSLANGALISAFASGNYTGSSIPTELRFETAPSGSTTRIERMRIESDGDVGVGTSTIGAQLTLEQTDSADSFRVNDEAGDTTPFVIDHLGAVGVGTTSPVGALDIRSDEVRSWTGGGTAGTATGAGDLYVEGDLEVDGTITAPSGLGGRSLTVSGTALDADTELYTDVKCVNIDPASTTTDWFGFKAPFNLTVTGIDCIVDASTSVVLTPNECDGNGANCTAIEAAITCATTNTTEASGVDNSSVDAGDWVRVVRGTVSGSPKQANICFEFTKND